MFNKIDIWTIKNLFEQLYQGNIDYTEACYKLDEYSDLISKNEVDDLIENN